MGKNNKVRVKEQSVLAKVKLFFEEIPDKSSSKKRQVPGRILKRNKKR
jgi:hypothetical protein